MVSKNPKKTLPVEEQPNKKLIGKAAITKVFKQVAPDNEIALECWALIFDFIQKISIFLLDGENITLNNLEKKITNKKFGDIGVFANREANKVSSKQYPSSFKIKTLHKNISKTFGKDLSDDLILYLAGVVEYLLAEFFEISSKYTNYEAKKRRITKAFIVKSLENDKEFKAFMKKINFKLE